ncbi:MAG: RnfABCDGE type electron transport complex subunit D [Bacillota bacterium]
MKMMKGMLIALAPAALFAIYLYRLDAVLLIIVGVAAAVASEALYQYITKKPLKIKDLSAVVTGLLLALTVSPSLPLYVVAVGSVVGIVIGKQAFGGYGKNIFNPALFGRLFIIYAFPGTMSPWLTPIDGLSTATPLQIFRSEGTLTPIYELFIGVIPGSLGESSALLLLIGGAWLIYKRYANWRIPVSVLAAVVIVCLLTGQNILFHFFSGSLILGAFFMATDPVSSPKTQPGRYIFGFGVGLIIMTMRLWGWLPEGTTFAIIGMNLLVPLINRFTRPQQKTKTT